MPVQPDDFTTITVAPYTPCLGAEIGGVDLRQPPSDALRDHLWTLLLQYKVLFFRNQTIDRRQHVAFARAFGQPEIYALHGQADHPEVSTFDSEYGRANLWHSDGTWRSRPALAAVLHGVVIPDVGGDTMWLDTEAAYEALSDDMKERIENLHAIHDSLRVGANEKRDSMGFEERQAEVRRIRQQQPLVAHPIVRTMPESGKRALFLNPALIDCIVGMDRAASQILLEKLYRHMLQPQFAIRFRWSEGAVAFWDERNTLHYGVADYGDAHRRVERVLLAGTEVPV